MSLQNLPPAAIPASAAAPGSGGNSGGNPPTGGTGPGSNPPADDKGANQVTYSYPPGTSAFTYGSGNPGFGLTKPTVAPLNTSAAMTNAAMNLGINNPISKVIGTLSSGIKTVGSTLGKAVVSTGQFISSVPSRIVSGVVSGTKSLISGIGNFTSNLFGKSLGGVVPNVGRSYPKAPTSYMSYGGTVPNVAKSYPKTPISYMAYGGRAMGSDTVPAMLTPGEFVMNKAATKAHGPLLARLNESKYPSMQRLGQGPSSQISNNISTSVSDNSSSVYTYNIGFNLNGSTSNPNEIARSVIKEIKM